MPEPNTSIISINDETGLIQDEQPYNQGVQIPGRFFVSDGNENHRIIQFPRFTKFINQSDRELNITPQEHIHGFIQRISEFNYLYISGETITIPPNFYFDVDFGGQLEIPANDNVRFDRNIEYDMGNIIVKSDNVRIRDIGDQIHNDRRLTRNQQINDDNKYIVLDDDAIFEFPPGSRIYNFGQVPINILVITPIVGFILQFHD